MYAKCGPSFGKPKQSVSLAFLPFTNDWFAHTTWHKSASGHFNQHVIGTDIYLGAYFIVG